MAESGPAKRARIENMSTSPKRGGTTSGSSNAMLEWTDPAWLEARLQLLEEEKALSKAAAALAAKRRSLPWRRVPEDYTFVGNGGETTLSQLFGDKEELIVYHQMMAEGQESGCSICAFFIDHWFGSLPHLQPRVALAIVSKCSWPQLSKYVRTKEGWDTSYFYSSGSSTFNEDFQVSFTPDQMKEKACTYNFNRKWNWGSDGPGLSVFRKTSEGIMHTYSTFAAGLGGIPSVLNLLDLTPSGRLENGEGGKGNFWWVKAKEEY